MATIYKVKIGKEFSKRNFTRSKAIEVRRHWESKGYKPKVVIWKEHQMIVDTTADITGVIRFYRKPTEQELKQMLKQEASK